MPWILRQSNKEPAPCLISTRPLWPPASASMGRRRSLSIYTTILHTLKEPIKKTNRKSKSLTVLHYVCHLLMVAVSLFHNKGRLIKSCLDSRFCLRSSTNRVLSWSQRWSNRYQNLPEFLFYLVFIVKLYHEEKPFSFCGFYFGSKDFYNSHAVV